jgi:hypothetical protein
MSLFRPDQLQAGLLTNLANILVFLDERRKGKTFPAWILWAVFNSIQLKSKFFAIDLPMFRTSIYQTLQFFSSVFK